MIKTDFYGLKFYLYKFVYDKV